jgi:hypothetical protein
LPGFPVFTVLPLYKKGMNSRLLLWFLLVFLMKCAPEKHGKAELWKVKATSSETFFLKAGTDIQLGGDSITFSGGGHSITFHGWKTSDRLMIETGASRQLFSIEKLSDSSMILHELYTRNPLTVSLIKTINH